jgi:hypothetical protein
VCAASGSVSALGLGVRSCRLELAAGKFSALGELLRPRTKHKRPESDSRCRLASCLTSPIFALPRFASLLLASPRSALPCLASPRLNSSRLVSPCSVLRRLASLCLASPGPWPGWLGPAWSDVAWSRLVSSCLASSRLASCRLASCRLACRVLPALLRLASLRLVSPRLASRRLASPRLASPRPTSLVFASRCLASPRLASSRLCSPRAASLRLASPRLTSSHLAWLRLASPCSGRRTHKRTRKLLVMVYRSAWRSTLAGLSEPGGRGPTQCASQNTLCTRKCHEPVRKSSQNHLFHRVSAKPGRQK